MGYKIYLLLVFSCLSFITQAQTGIGTTTPDASAKLEVASSNKGFLPPRVALTATNATSPITSPANGLLVYNTATSGSSPNNVTPGFYYYNSSSWVRLIGPADNSTNVTGIVAIANGGTGTTTGSITGTGALTFTAGGTNQNINLTPSGTGNTIVTNNVGIGNTTPTDRLIVGSSIAMHDGGDKVLGFGWSPGSGKAIVAGFPTEIRSEPGSGRMSFGTDATTRALGASASVVKRMSITSEGRVGIGTDNPGATLEIGSSNGSVPGYLVLNPTTTGTGLEGAEIDLKPAPVATTPAAQTWVIDQVSDANNPRLRFFPSGNGEPKGFSIRDNGNLGIGTATPYHKLHVQSSDGTAVYIESTTADNNGMMILNANTNQNWSANWHEFIYFRNQGTNIGGILGSNGGNMVSYSTSSDYRLKTDFKNYNGLALVNKIKTYDYAWKRDSSRMYGVMAHELQSVLPYAVTGQKDAVDATGKIIPQAVDYSKLTPILIKAIQEQDATIKAQEIEINKLKAEKELMEKSILMIQRRLLTLENKKK